MRKDKLFPDTVGLFHTFCLINDRIIDNQRWSFITNTQSIDVQKSVFLFSVLTMYYKGSITLLRIDLNRDVLLSLSFPTQKMKMEHAYKIYTFPSSETFISVI